MKYYLVVMPWLACLMLGSFVHAADSTAILVSLQEKHQAAQQELIQRHQQTLAQFAKEYTGGLDTLDKDMRKSGNLDGVLAVRKEKERLVFDAAIPDPKDEGTDGNADTNIVVLRTQYWQKVRKASQDRDRNIVTLAQQYATKLGTVEKDLTKAGEIENALAVREEVKRVMDSEAVRTARETLAVSKLSDAIVAESPRKSASAQGPERPAIENTEKQTATEAALDRVRISTFSVQEWEWNPIEVINRFIQEVYPKGIPVRVEASSLNIRSSFNDNGVPRYFSGGSHRVEYNGIRHQMVALTDIPARTVLNLICARLKLGYRIDPITGELIFLDRQAVEATWTAPTIEEVREGLRTFSGTKRKAVGKPVVLTCELSGTMQGLRDWTLSSNKDRTRFIFPKANLSEDKFNDIKNQLVEMNKRNRNDREDRNVVEITVLGEVGGNSATTMIVLENCRLLSFGSGYRGSSDGGNGGNSSNKKIKRMGE